MTKEKLLEIGINEEQAAQVLALVGDVIPRSRFNEVNESNKQLKEQLKERDTQLEQLKAADNSEELKARIADLQAANEKATADYEAQVKAMKLDHAVEAALTGAKAKNLTAVKALLDLANAEVDEKGLVKGLDKQIKALTEAEGTAFLFESAAPPAKGIAGMSPVPTPAGGGEGSQSLGASFAAAYNATVAPAGNGSI